MRRSDTTMFAVVVAAFLSSVFPQQASAADTPVDRVVVMYFHRTQRCPTCLKMGSYTEEAVKTGFAKQLKERTVGFYYIDFQDKKNASLAKAYRVGGPALIVAKVVNKKVAKVNNLKDIWTKVREKKAFLKYVQDNVATYCKPAPQTAAAARQKRQEPIREPLTPGPSPRKRGEGRTFSDRQ